MGFVNHEAVAGFERFGWLDRADHNANCPTCKTVEMTK